MAETISTIGCVLGILASIVTLSQTATEFVDDARSASSEIRCLSHDVHAFFAVVCPVNIALREEGVKDVVDGDAAMRDMFNNLADQLRHCQLVLTSLQIKMRERLPRADRRTSIALTSLKWALYLKTDIANVQLLLERTKSTLNNSLNAVTMLV